MKLITIALVLIGALVLPGCEENMPAKPEPTPAQEPVATCDDSAIRLLNRSDTDAHGAIVDDTLYLAGKEAPAMCTQDVSLAIQIAGPAVYSAHTRQGASWYMLIVVYDSDNVRVYVVRTDDDTECIINTRNECVAQVTELADGFDVSDLPRNVPATVPGGRAQPAPDNPEPPPASPPVPPVGATPGPGPDNPESLPLPPSTFALSDKPTSFKVGVGPDVSAGLLELNSRDSFTGGESVSYKCAEASASWIIEQWDGEVEARPRPAHVGDSETITCTATNTRYTGADDVIETLSVTYTFTVVRRTLIENARSKPQPSSWRRHNRATARIRIANTTGIATCMSCRRHFQPPNP